MKDKIFIDGEEYRYIELKNKQRYVSKNGVLIDAKNHETVQNKT